MPSVNSYTENQLPCASLLPCYDLMRPGRPGSWQGALLLNPIRRERLHAPISRQTTSTTVTLHLLHG